MGRERRTALPPQACARDDAAGAVQALPSAAAHELGLAYPCGDAPGTGEGRRVAPGVQWLRLPLPGTLGHINLWAVQEEGGWAVFDCGMSTPDCMAAWRALLAPDGPLGGRPPTRLIATHMHSDHVGLAGWLHREYGCELWMTRGEYLQARLNLADGQRAAPPEALAFQRRAGWDAAQVEEFGRRFGSMGRVMAPLPETYRRVQDGQRLRIGAHDWHVVVGSGHSPEHASFHCPALGLLVSGDQVLPLISSNVSAGFAEPLADPMAEWLDALAKVARTVPDDVLVLPAHDEPFHGLHARVRALADRRHDALDRLREALQEAPLRAVDTLHALFGRKRFADPTTFKLATGEAVAYLSHLLARGEIAVADDAQGVAWYRAAAQSPPDTPSKETEA